jgi:biotin carboxylase
MLELLSAATLAPACRSRAAKLIIPRNGGYIVRSDIVPLRISSAPRVIYTCSLADPQQWFPGVRETDIDLSHLSKVFQVAAGGVIIDAGQSAYDVAADLDAFEVEVRNRLSFPWLLKERRSRQTLVFVGNYLRHPGHGGTGANHYTFARALGIDLVVLDAHGCWLENPYYAEFRKAFLPCDLSRNDELCDRIIDTLSQYKERIHGIVTFHESLQVGVAKAAELLGLLTLPPAALGIAADKYETGIFAGHASYLAMSAKEALKINKEKRLRFPLILKPCRGWGSEGVYKTENALEFAEAAVAIEAHAKLHGPRFVIEEYCDGPEVDVNMVLSNSELLFAEINDDLPNRSNGKIKGAVQEFLETGQVYPSSLPSSELNMLVRDMHQTLLRIGLPSGVFHLEARIKDSGMIYGVRDGILDLEERQTVHPIKSPKTWVLEINARPPGIGASDPAEVTYGIDYVGLGLLFALGDEELIEALSHPFLQGPQYWCQPVLIPVDKGGVFDSDDVCNELLLRRPELAQYVSRSVCYWKKGDTVPSTMFSAWVAHFIVFSRVSRRHLLEICETIRKEVRYSIV